MLDDSKIIPFSRFNRPKAVLPMHGDGTAPVFEERFVDGHRELVEVGREPLNEFVQASLADTQIYNIIARYERGDSSALSKCVGQFIDVVGMPTNLAEAQNALLSIERQFNDLPSEVKQKFGNNVNEFIQVVSDGKLNDALSDFHVKSEVKSEVNTDVKDGVVDEK